MLCGLCYNERISDERRTGTENVESACRTRHFRELDYVSATDIEKTKVFEMAFGAEEKTNAGQGLKMPSLLAERGIFGNWTM
jgi:hypothetical protein